MLQLRLTPVPPPALDGVAENVVPGPLELRVLDCGTMGALVLLEVVLLPDEEFVAVLVPPEAVGAVIFEGSAPALTAAVTALA